MLLFVWCFCSRPVGNICRHKKRNDLFHPFCVLASFFCLVFSLFFPFDTGNGKMVLTQIRVGLPNVWKNGKPPFAMCELSRGKHTIFLGPQRDYRTVIHTLIHESIHIALDDLHLYRASIMLDNIASEWHNKYEAYGL